MNKPTIRITCRAAITMALHEMSPLQGGLKALSADDRARLLRLILKHGYTHPISIWQSEGKNWILDGHHRYQLLNELADEYHIPPLPVILIEAQNLAEAKEKLLAISSQFATVDSEELYRFIQDIESINLDDFKLPDFSMVDFKDHYLTEGGAPPDLHPPDTVSNTRTYGTETHALEKFLGSEIRRLTVYMNPADYDRLIPQLSTIATQQNLTDYKDVLFYLIDHYEKTGPS